MLTIAFLQVLLLHPATPLAIFVPPMHIEASAVSCCLRTTELGTPVFSCKRVSDIRCVSSSRVVATAGSKRVVVTIRNQGGWLHRGENSFCIEVLDRKTTNWANLVDLKLDVTLRIGHVEAVRAVTYIEPNGPGHYCAKVALPLRGLWTLAVRYKSATGSGRIFFLENIT
jgi:hypothetical protein